MKRLQKYDVDVREYEEAKAREEEEQKARPPEAQKGQKQEEQKELKHPFDKLRQVDKRLITDREMVEKGGARVIVVHCTHGFNRSGFMFCHLLKRFGPTSLTVADCLKQCVPLSLCVMHS
jgi:hypothetical protein